MLMMYGGADFRHRDSSPLYWIRRKVTLSADQLPHLKYLQVLCGVWQGRSYATYCEAYVNGSSVAMYPKPQPRDIAVSFDVANILHFGENTLTLCLHGVPPAGLIALGEMPSRRYPYMTVAENRLWYDTVNFSAWLRMRNLEDNLKAMRAGDPDRPLKVMATGNMLDISQDLCAKYGAYQHDTGGAGGFWNPMSGARLSHMHGLPWSCEQGGPPTDAATIQANMTFYLMYGCDAVDLVFNVSHYRDNPSVSAWVDDNLDLMHCIGKMTMPQPSVGILRSARTTRLGYSDPWNWDLGRGALQAIGRNFEYVDIPDVASGEIDKFPIVIDDGTVLFTDEDVRGLLRYVRAGGIFIAQHDTGRNSEDRADTWPLAAALGLKVDPKRVTSDNYTSWPLGNIKFTDTESVVPSLHGKSCEGIGVSIDYAKNATVGAIGLTGEGRDIQPVANWQDGTMAVADVHLGKGRLLYLGSPFYVRMQDDQGKWVNRQDLSALLDEMLTGLGAPRDSCTTSPDVWAEHWLSKNGVYDLYPTACMLRKADGPVPAKVSLRRDSAPDSLVEISAKGHPAVAAAIRNGRFDLPPAAYSPMQFRMYAAPRKDIANAAINWLGIQAALWRALPPIAASERPAAVSVPEDVIPAIDGWRMSTTQSGEAWAAPKFDDSPWKSVKLGSFPALGLPDQAVAQFRKTIAVPASWQGCAITLAFDAEWSWGISNGKLWVNGLPVSLSQSGQAAATSAVTVDITDIVKGSPSITLALSIDGHLAPGANGRQRPGGVLGAFYLQATPRPVQETPLPNPWQAASDLNLLVPTSGKSDAKAVYLETKFALPSTWPSKRLFLSSPSPLGCIMLNGQIVSTPTWMKTLDISGLVKRDGENVLRWVPRDFSNIDYGRAAVLTPPSMRLSWLP